MEKKIADYLPYYIGQKIIGTYNDGSGSVGYLTGVTNGGAECEIQFILEDGINVEEEPQFNEAKEVKLILRPLSSMTKEEKLDLYKLIYPRSIEEDDYMRVISIDEFIEWKSAICILPDFAYGIKWMLSKGFDIFGLIESGLAIEKTT